MSYQALYRVFRPRNFADLVGQEHVTRTLQNALEQETFTHAYLFSGPRGTGKTSAAKIFAQAVNCEQAPTREPCQTCPTCRGILDDSIADVIEIDAASNTSVDDIREIRDKIKYATGTVPYKVYIIDEVHMISTNAFNALLKTLEEPPAHVIFILATTEPHKIPLTIISRCQRFDFKPIQQETIVSRLEVVVESEGINVAKEALETIALIAEGGMRDALSILDQAISYSDGVVELEDVLAITGSVDQQTFIEIIGAMANKETKKTLNLFDHILQQGKDGGRFVYDLIYFLRDMLLYKSAPSLDGIFERAIVDDSFIQLSEKISADWIQQVLTQLNETQQEMKWTNNPKIYIEIALLRITSNEPKIQSTVKDEQIDQLIKRINGLENELKALRKGSVQQQQVTQPRRPQPRSRSSRANYQVPFEQITHVLTMAEKQYLQRVQKIWVSFLEQLRQVNTPAHATIQDSQPVAASDGSLIVAFKYEIHCSLFLDHKETVESVLTQVIGSSYTIIPIPEEEWQRVRAEYIKNQAVKNGTEKQHEEDPIVEEARKLVGDELIHIHD